MGLPIRTPAGRTRHSIPAWVVAASACFCLSAEGAQARTVDLQIDARQSRLGIVEPKFVDVGPGSFQVTLDPPTRGTPMPLPGGGSTDGLTTFLEGQIRIEREPNRIRFLRRGTTAILGSSGEWFPGTVDPMTAAPGDFAISFNDGAGAFTGEAVLRDGGASVQSDWLPLTETSPGSGMFEFPADVQFLVTTGVLDVATNVPMLSGRRLLLNFPQMNAATPGTLAVLGDGRVSLSLPVQVHLIVDGPIEPPVRIELTLRGSVAAATVAAQRTTAAPAASVAGLAILVILLGTFAVFRLARTRQP